MRSFSFHSALSQKCIFFFWLVGITFEQFLDFFFIPYTPVPASVPTRLFSVYHKRNKAKKYPEPIGIETVTQLPLLPTTEWFGLGFDFHFDSLTFFTIVF